MEWLAIAFVLFLFYLATRKDDTLNAPTPSRSRGTSTAQDDDGSETFFAKLEPAVGNDGNPIPSLFLVWVRGYLQAPDATPAFLRVMIFDKEIGEGAPVFTQNSDQQADNGPAFLCIRSVGYTSGNRIYLGDWTSPGIPVVIDSLVGPIGGKRELHLDVQMLQADGHIFWRAEVPFTAELDFGYRDVDDRRAANQALSIQLAVAVASASDGIHDAEIDAINTWIKKNIEGLEGEEKTKLKKALIASLRLAQQRAEAGTLPISKLITKLKNEGTRSGRMMAVELCFSVMAADGIASADELETVNKIASKLEVDPQLLSSARDKSLSGLSGGAVNTRDRYAILGIDTSADPATIRTQLSALYKKWSSRATTLTDPAKRKEAEDMLRLIAEVRAEH
jgi:hypothetical protein